MKHKRIFTGMTSMALSAIMVAGYASPIMAMNTGATANWNRGTDDDNIDVSKDNIDPTKKGSITIYKLDEENGNTSEGDGMKHSATNDVRGKEEMRDGIPNIIFSTVKVGDLKQPNGTNDKNNAKEVGYYFTNLDSGFIAVVKDCDLDLHHYQTSIDGSGDSTNWWDDSKKEATDVAKSYWFSTEQMEALLEDIKDTNGDGNTWTGETLLNSYVEQEAKKNSETAKDFAPTGSQLKESERKMYSNGVDANKTQEKGKTVMDDMPLGLYLIAETGYTEKVDGHYQKVYRDYVYDDDGLETKNAEASHKKQSNADDTSSSEKQVSNNDNNYNDDTDIEKGKARNGKEQRYSTYTEKDTTKTGDSTNGKGSKTKTPDYGKDTSYTDAEDGTQNPYVIDTPCSPFFVSVPQTNIADITKDGVTHKAGTVWQYDLNVYPKNNMTSITKKVVADNGDDLTERQDYYIGQNIHQVIYADSPVTMYTKNDKDSRRNKEYKISDTMSKGLTFQRITRVALRGKVANPDKLSEFDKKDTDAANAEQYGTDIELVAGEDYNIIYKTNEGTKADVSGGTDNGTVAGSTDNTSKVSKKSGKYYADSEGKVPDYKVGDAPDVDKDEVDNVAKNHDGTKSVTTASGKTIQGDNIVGRTGQKSSAEDGAAPNGEEYIQGFTVELTDKGLDKLDHQKVASQVIVEFDSVLNKNAIIGAADGKTFNTNRPTLTWRNQSGLERKVEGNPVHIFTYELDLTKRGKSTKGTKDINGNTVSDDHDFDAGDVSFAIQQQKQYNPDLTANKNIETDNAYMMFVQDRDASGKLIDGSYHIWTPADGAIEGIITQDAKRQTSTGTNNSEDGGRDNKDNYRKDKDGKGLAAAFTHAGKALKATSFDAAFKEVDADADGFKEINGTRYNTNKYPVTAVGETTLANLSKDLKGYGYKGDTGHNNYGADKDTAYGFKTVTVNGKTALATTDTNATKTCVVTQLISPAHSKSVDDPNGEGYTNAQEGLLKIRGLDSETYIVTEKSTSSHFNLLKDKFSVTLNKENPADGNLIANKDGNNGKADEYGASLSTKVGLFDVNETRIPLSHEAGIVSMTVENYKTITLHTGGNGTWYIYLLAAALAGGAVYIAVSNRKKKVVQ